MTTTTAAERLKKALLAHADAETLVAKENAKKAALEALGEVVEERDARRSEKLEAMTQESFARVGIEHQRTTQRPATFQTGFDESLPNLHRFTAEERAGIAGIKDSFERLSRLKWPA